MENKIPELTEFQKISLRNLKMVGIEVEFVEEKKLRIRQVNNYNNYILTKKELVNRAKDIFPDFIAHPVRFSLTLKDIDPIWVAAKIKEIGLHTNDILSQTAIDRTSLSLYLSGEKKMTATVKALFYYYFLSFELNRDLRGELNDDIHRIGMQEELTEKMHAELTISPEAELRIKVELALSDMKKYKYSIAQVMELYWLTAQEIKSVKKG